ncbi:PilN domain-containing protein [Vibrio nigripulchritudo]|uniref:PilN domain-containing protein n=1 Tax=Vibrio nigripulchritudo TaxID=28173 RepID=UPI0005FA24B0|nr:PilN domain-containing protein [Vibrio nigripulchritudo]KJY79011.1 pilus assembly protein PilN [Vibrio nigripulchritudo]
MHSVNLLPWRDEMRARYRRQFFSYLAAAILAAVGVQWGVGVYFSKQMSVQEERNAELTRHISYLDQQLRGLSEVRDQHESILTRLRSVEALQIKRNKTTDFMSHLPDTIPPGVYVDKIEMNDFEVEVNGISDSTANITTMLDSMERSAKLADVEMHSIVSGKKLFGKVFKTFKVSFIFAPIKEEKS